MLNLIGYLYGNSFSFPIFTRILLFEVHLVRVIFDMSPFCLSLTFLLVYALILAIDVEPIKHSNNNCQLTTRKSSAYSWPQFCWPPPFNFFFDTLPSTLYTTTASTVWKMCPSKGKLFNNNRQRVSTGFFGYHGAVKIQVYMSSWKCQPQAGHLIKPPYSQHPTAKKRTTKTKEVEQNLIWG